MKVHYFAYGSNIPSEHLRSRIASVEIIGPAFEKDCIMVFDKRSKDGYHNNNFFFAKIDIYIYESTFIIIVFFIGSIVLNFYTFHSLFHYELHNWLNLHKFQLNNDL